MTRWIRTVETQPQKRTQVDQTHIDLHKKKKMIFWLKLKAEKARNTQPNEDEWLCTVPAGSTPRPSVGVQQRKRTR